LWLVGFVSRMARPRPWCSRRLPAAAECDVRSPPGDFRPEIPHRLFRNRALRPALSWFNRRKETFDGRSHIGRAFEAPTQDCSASWPIGAARARARIQRLAIGRDRLLEPRRATFVLAERLKRIAEIVLRRGPLERYALARIFLQRLAIGRDRLL
jgi:hypothetical protein